MTKGRPNATAPHEIAKLAFVDEKPAMKPVMQKLTGLKSFSSRELQSIFRAPAVVKRVDAQIGLSKTPRILRRPTKRRQMLNKLSVANAAKELARLPEPDESVHVIMRGNFDGWSLVPAVLRLAAPATIEALYVATLGFTGSNVVELLSLLDSGRIGRVTFVCSCYFKGSNEQEFNRLSEALVPRGQRLKAARTHAKILLLKLTDGRSIVIEMSSNLRSCRSIEQMCMTQSDELLAFHASWIDELFKGEPDARTKTKTNGTEDRGREPGTPAAQPTRAKAAARRSRRAKPSIR